MNRYLYALANPTTLVDPDGHAACIDIGTTCVPSVEGNNQLAKNRAVARKSTGGGSGGGGTPPPSDPRWQAMGVWSPWVETRNGPVYVDLGGYVNERGEIFTNLECLQWSGLPCASTLDPWRGFGGSASTDLGGWSPLEYLAGTSTEGARNTLRLLDKFQSGQNTGDWWPYLLDAGALTAKAGLEGASVIGGFGALSWISRGRNSMVASGSTTELGEAGLSSTGRGNAAALREWAASNGWSRQPRMTGPEVWGEPTEAGQFEWRLKLKFEGSIRPGLPSQSWVPRFDARLGPGDYINPFTGELGGRGIGTHLPLDYRW